MRTSLFAGFSVLFAFLPGACSSGNNNSEPPPADGGPTEGGMSEGGPDAASATTNIKHVVVIIQENHTFDDHFGGYCTAAPGSNPTCNQGPACCEAMPATDPAGVKPTVLTDAQEAAYDPPHDSKCETAEIDNGKMDMFASAPGCGKPANVAIADPTIVMPYWSLAASGALADRYFQPIIGQSSSNDMYLARSAFVFTDNTVSAMGAVGVQCEITAETPMQYTDQTIGDLLTAASVPWAFYAEGYAAMVAAGMKCPAAPMDCPLGLSIYPCAFDPGDVPFEYYRSTVDNPTTMKDLADFGMALDNGGLPAVSFVKALGYKTEHPGYKTTLSAGVTFVTGVLAHIAQSQYASSTLVLVTYDEGGGHFDHVAPPPASKVDGKPYGTRVPLLVAGPFAKKGFVSHVVMEHSSIVKFIEYNWLGGMTGQLQQRDAVVANIGSLLDPTATGVPVPEQ